MLEIFNTISLFTLKNCLANEWASMAKQMPHTNTIHKIRAPVFEKGGIASHQLRCEV
jgi:hypothetical protein